MASSNEPNSPPWQTGTRLVAGVLLFIFVGWFIYGVRQLWPMLIMALLLAYILQPLIKRLAKLTRMPHGLVVLLLYFLILLLMLGATTGVGFAVVQQLIGLIINIGDLIDQIPNWLSQLEDQVISLGPWEVHLSQVNLEPIANQLISSLQPLIRGTGALLASFASIAASTIGIFILVMVISIYLSVDFDKLRGAVLGLVPDSYDKDVSQLMDQTAEVWQAFLRGQLILGVVVGSAVALVLSILGVKFALGLGLIAGLMEFIPIFGPFIAGAVAGLVALFQVQNWFGLPPFWYAMLVVGVFIIIQQIENHILVPRIIGHSLNINPLLVLLTVLAGGLLAGVLGVLLAAPIFATLRIWLGYLYRKIVDLGSEPQPVLIPPPKKEVPELLRKYRKWFDPRRWIQKIRRRL